MSTPEPSMGNREGALVSLSMAFDLIQRALPALGHDSDAGRAANGALKSLTAALGPHKPNTDELQASEIMQLLGSLPQAGNVTPEVAAVLGPSPAQPPKAAVPPIPQPGPQAPGAAPPIAPPQPQAA
jgi:hypothetical protein